MAEKLVKLMDCFNELLNKILQEEEKQKQILEELSKVKQPHRNVLYKNYIQGKRFEKIADEMGYDYKYITNLNGYALNEFDKIVEKNG